MKIAVAGGLGFEEELVRALTGPAGHSVALIGSAYDIKKEKFLYPPGEGFTGEYLTHNYREILSSCDLFIDISENMKSKFIMNDASAQFGKKLLAVVYREGWKLAVVDPAPGNGCLQCAMPYVKPLPPFTLPDVPAGKAVDAITRSLDGPGSSIIDLEKDSSRSIVSRPDCDVTRGSCRFLNGEMADVSAVSCSDVSVAITPMNELALDLGQYKQMLESRVKIVKLSPYFLQFKAGKFDCTLFRLGRMVVKGTKEKNTALCLYRNFIGS